MTPNTPALDGLARPHSTWAAAIIAPWRGRPALRAIVGALGFIAAALCIYWPAVHGTWLWDDADEIFVNPVLRDPHGLASIWAGAAGADYYPLKTSIEWLLWRAWGGQVVAWHLLNIALHLTSAALLWRILAKLRFPLAWLGALVFTIHPLAVESVAWMAEIKNTLSLPFALAAFSAYLDFDASRRARDWGLAFLLFVAAILCKSAVVMLPAALLIWVMWRHAASRWRRCWPLAPFFVAAIADGLITIAVQHHRAMADAPAFAGTLIERIARAGAALLFYGGKCLWPFDLIPVYPAWHGGVSNGLVRAFGPWMALAALATALALLRGPTSRGLLAGGAMAAAMLAPVLGVVTMPFLEFSWVADHYAYPALPIVAALVAAGASVAWRKLPARWSVPFAGAFAAAAGLWILTARTHAEIFRSPSAFWVYVERRNPESAIAEYEIGKLLLQTGQTAPALARFTTALDRDSTLVNARIDRAAANVKIGRTAEALADLDRAIAGAPGYAPAYVARGNLLLANGHTAEAKQDYEIAVRLQPWSAAAHNDLGAALWQLGDSAAALAEFETAVRLDPTLTTARSNVAIARGAPDTSRSKPSSRSPVEIQTRPK